MPRHLLASVTNVFVARQGLHSSVYKCENFIVVLCMYLRVLLASRTHNIPFSGCTVPSAPRQCKLQGNIVYIFSDYPTVHTNNITSVGGWWAYPSLLGAACQDAFQCG